MFTRTEKRRRARILHRQHEKERRALVAAAESPSNWYWLKQPEQGRLFR
jgi:hypothetical protein